MLSNSLTIFFGDRDFGTRPPADLRTAVDCCWHPRCTAASSAAVCLRALLSDGFFRFTFQNVGKENNMGVSQNGGT